MNATSSTSKQALFYENEDVDRLSLFVSRGYRTQPIFYVNGYRISEKLAALARPNQTLLSFLRETLRLTGSKLGCAEGGCGACTVMLSKAHFGTIQHISVNACLMPALAADGCHITTVEGIGSVKHELHPVQQAMVDMHGSQCGFCTPGIIVSLYTLLTRTATVDHLEEHLDGNLCRCTGYRPIWDAARSLCTDGLDMVRGPCGTPCAVCPEHDTCAQECNVTVTQGENGNLCSSSSNDKMKTYKDTLLTNKETWLNQPNTMFPAELLDTTSDVCTELQKPLVVMDATEYQTASTWFKPTSLIDMLTLLHEYPSSCKVVVGNTEVGIETRFKHKVYPRLIAPADSIGELYTLTATATTLSIGACTSLSTIQHYCGTTAAATQSSGWARTVTPVHDMLRWFASTQIRNVACLGGNLVTASPISDMNPMLAALGGQLVLSSWNGTTREIVRRRVDVAQFFLHYRTVDLQPTEVVECIEIPVLADVFEYLKPFKQARRREDDISIVTSGMRLRLANVNGVFVIDDVALAFGGMAPVTIMATETAKAMIGKEFNAATFVAAQGVLLKELSLSETVPGGQAAFRMTLAASFLHKFFLSVIEDLTTDVTSIQNDPSKFPGVTGTLPAVPAIDEIERSASENFLSAKKPSSYGVQRYPAPRVSAGLEQKELAVVNLSESSKPLAAVVGKASSHMSGPLHCTGEALYTDDIPLPPDTLQAALILSSECGGVLESMDPSEAMNVPGVFAIYTHVDIDKLGGSNVMGPIVPDEIIFLPVGEKIRTVGQVLGIVVAESLESAELGARLVKVQYGATEGKVIVTIDDAISAGSFYDFARHRLERGDRSILSNLSESVDTTSLPKVGDFIKVSGSCRTGPQEHFYLETNSVLVVPSESDTNLTVYASTQAPTKTQSYCASATGTPSAKVVVRVKRMGGGFGGKETRSVFASAAAAIAAKRSSRPVRLTLPRDVDMKITGTRHAFMAEYQASAQITENGAKLVAFDAKIYANGGCAYDLSGPVVDRCLFHVDGCYFYPNFRVEGVPCKTAQAPHTAFRGFGGPQGITIAEHVMDHLALACGVPGDDLRRHNLYKDGDHIPFGMVVGEQTSGKWNVPVMWDRLSRELQVQDRRGAIETFNSNNKWTKRGLAFLPTKFGIAFTAKFMNQGGALVHVYTDGTVLVSHGGTEMGQGIHTKVCQVAAQAFGIPLDNVYINDSSTDKVANTIPTAASMSTDTYGMATLDACHQILARLVPIREQLGPQASFREVAQAAHFARIDLSAHGFFALDSSRCGYFWDVERPADFPDAAPENSWKGHPFNYFTQGVVCTEVEVDFLTGNHRTLQADILVDVGASINPAIDIGQIEGAFIQGMGWSTMEEIVYACDDHAWVRPRGAMYTTGPDTYKLPAFNDVPEVFNVSLLDNADNPFAVHSSKAIGEPPFFLGTSVFFALKDAVRAARKQNLGTDEYFEMRLPATSERIRMYGADSIVEHATKDLRNGSNVGQFQPQGTF